MSKHSIIVVMIAFIIVAVMPVSARDVAQYEPVYIGDQHLNLTHALNQANGLTGADIDKIPIYTKIGWWASAATILTIPPNKIIDLTGRYTDFTVQSTDFGCTGGNFYLLDNGGALANHQISNVFYMPNPTLPESSFTATKVGGSGSLTVQFTDTTSDNPTYWYWSFGDGTTSNLQNPSHTFSSVCNPQMGNGIYSVELSTRDNNYNICKDKTAPFVFPVSPQPVSSFNANQTSGPAPLSIQFTDTSSNNPTGWSWNFGDGTTSNLQNPSHRYTISGVYSVTMLASFPDFCSLGSPPATTTITVFSPLAPTATTTTTSTTTPTQTTTTTTTVAPNTTITTAATTIPTTSITTAQTTVLTTATTAPIVTTYITRSPTPKVTIKNPTPWPTDTPTQPSPLGIEIGIIAIISAALLIMKRK